MVNAFMPKKGAFMNSVDTDEMPQNAASHQGLRYLPYVKHNFGKDGQY